MMLYKYLQSNYSASLIIAAVLLAPSGVYAENLTYKFVNPSFGGNPFLSSHLLGLANAQYTKPVVPRATVSDAEYFADQIQRRALSSISSILISSLRDIDLSDEGSFQFDDLRVDFRSENGTIFFNIDDGINTIQLELPDYGALLAPGD